MRIIIVNKLGGSSLSLCEEDDDCILGMEKAGEMFIGQESLYLNEKLSDVEMYVQSPDKSSKWRFPCHKVVLCAASTVFEEVLREVSIVNGKKTIILHGRPEIIQIVLSFVYGKSVDLYDWKTACDVYKVALIYEISPLKKKCDLFLKKSITLRNVCHILELSNKYELKELKEQCLNLCKNAGFVILHTDAFTQVNSTTMELIVSLKNLNVRNELSVFRSLWSWATMACVKSQVPTTERNIFDKFAPFNKYVGFEYFTEKIRQFLPTCVQEGYSVRLGTAKATTKGLSPYLSSARVLEFPPKIESYFNSVSFIYTEPVHTEGSIIECIRFSVSIDAYLTSFTVMSLERMDHKGYTKTRYYIESIELISDMKSFSLWNYNDPKEDYFKVDKVEICMSSSTDETKVIEMTFDAIRSLPMQGGSVFTLQIHTYKPNKEEFSKWPAVHTVNDNEQSDIELILHSKVCRGLRKLSFLQAF